MHTAQRVTPLGLPPKGISCLCVGEEYEPVQVAGNHAFKSLSAGSDHTCGVAAQGEAYCWGASDNGQTGTGKIFDN